MRKYPMPVLAATLAFALAGCDSTSEADDAAADGAMAESTATTMDAGTVAAPAATETVIATPGASTITGTDDVDDGTTTVTTGPNGTSVQFDGRDVDASVGPGGVTATVAPDR